MKAMSRVLVRKSIPMINLININYSIRLIFTDHHPESVDCSGDT